VRSGSLSTCGEGLGVRELYSTSVPAIHYKSGAEARCLLFPLRGRLGGGFTVFSIPIGPLNRRINI